MVNGAVQVSCKLDGLMEEQTDKATHRIFAENQDASFCSFLVVAIPVKVL